jgi:Dyp-type peroxidase family
VAEFGVDELKDIQGAILSGFAHLPFASYLFLQITDAAAGREWLARTVPQVTTAEPWERRPDGSKRKPRTTLTVGLTFAGLKRLGLPEDALNTFEPEFIGGMASRAQILGDTGDSSPDNWEVGGPNTPEVHALLWPNAPDEATLEASCATLRRELEASHGGVIEVNEQQGSRPDSSKEPFGFLDSISQPEIERSPGYPEPSRTVVRTGEFVLGYVNGYDEYALSPGVPARYDPDDLLPPFPEGGVAGWKDLGRHGTFLVYRKLAQDVAGFWNLMAENAPRNPDGTPDVQEMIRLGSKCIGRWPSGAPLTLSPAKDDPALGADDSANNDFLYQATDKDGFGCPVGAHVRRANPRDSRFGETVDASITTSNRHRILRRGVSFGTDLFPRTDVERGKIPDGLRDDGEQRGLHFVALNASIRRQFEFVQAIWCNEDSFNGLFGDKDPLGNNDGTSQMTIQRAPLRTFLPHFPRVVTVRAGGYFFLPSLTALRFLAGSRGMERTG